MDDPFIDMASLILSRQRASKNKVKKHFIEHKERQGYTIEIVDLQPYPFSGRPTDPADYRLTLRIQKP